MTTQISTGSQTDCFRAPLLIFPTIDANCILLTPRFYLLIHVFFVWIEVQLKTKKERI